MTSCQIVFNLQPATEHLFLPTANIVQADKNGQLTHVLQKATPETLRPYGLEITPPLARIFQIVETLAPRFLEEKFRPPKSKTPTPLNRLLAEPATKTTVEAFIFREMDVFLSEIAQNRLPLSLDAQKKSLVKDHLIAFPADELLPHMHFKKTPDGVEFRLQLGSETEKWLVSQREVMPLTNTVPAWTLVGHDLFRVPGINGNMIGTFRKKDLVKVPENLVRDFFKKVIVKSASRTSIEAEGFDMDSSAELLAAELSISEDFLQKTWQFGLTFRYAGREFSMGERRRQHTWVEFPEGKPLIVKQVKRDDQAENQKAVFLKKLGLQNAGQAFSLPGKTDFETAIHWLSENRAALENANFEIAPPEMEGRKIAALAGEIAVRAERKTDWFDVSGTVRAGGFEFPFKKLLPFLRRDERFFPLPDGTFFLIPAAWFSDFSEIALAVSEFDGSLRLPKSLFTLLEGKAGLSTRPGGLTNLVPDVPDETQLPDFQTPASLRATLYPYQLEGVKWLAEHHRQGFGACLADDMGLGKTLQTIAVLLWAREVFRGFDNGLPPQPPEGGGLSEEHKTLVFKALNSAQAPPPSGGRGAGIAYPRKTTKPQSSLQLDLFAAPLPEERFVNFQKVDKSEHRRPEPQTPKLASFTALIILPASLIFNWRAELEKFTEGLFTYVHSGQKRLTDARLVAAHDIVLTTYHTARNDLDLLGQIDWSYIVLDESQQIKNRESEISKVVRGLRARHKVSLSGTPIENSLSDLWTQMEFINPATLGSFAQFKKQFLLPIERDDDPAAKAALLRRVQPFFLRRTKREVAPDLPELTEQVFFSEMKPRQKELYETVKSGVRNKILSLFDDPKSKLLVIQALTRLRQIALHPALLPDLPEGFSGEEISSGKFDDALEQWQTARRSGHKVLIFSSFEKYLRQFRAVLEKEKTPFAWLTGQTPNAERGREVARFQEDPSVQVFMATTKAGGAGINLTAADHVFLLDPWWNPAVERQAIARAHRLGLGHPVSALRFIAVGTVEEKIRDLQARKSLLGDGLFPGENEMPNWGREEWEAVLG